MHPYPSSPHTHYSLSPQTLPSSQELSGEKARLARYTTGRRLTDGPIYPYHGRLHRRRFLRSQEPDGVWGKYGDRLNL